MAASLYKWLVLPAFAVFCSFAVRVEVKQSTPPPGNLHPLFVCVTEINHNAADKTLEISSKIFVDDFEKVLTQVNKSVISIAHPKDKIILDKQISKYISQHLSLKADGKPVSFTYLGFEKEEDAIYCYMQVDNIPSVKKIEAINSMLHDLNNNQINIMHVTVGGNRKSQKMDYPTSESSFSF